MKLINGGPFTTGHCKCKWVQSAHECNHFSSFVWNQQPLFQKSELMRVSYWFNDPCHYSDILVCQVHNCFFCPQATTDLKNFYLPMFQTCQTQPNTRLKISLLLVGTTAMQLCWTLEILVRSGSLKSVSGLRMKRRWQPRLLLPRSLSSTTYSCPPWSL